MSLSECQSGSGERLGEVLTLSEAATYLRVSEAAVSKLVADHAIPAQSIGGELRFLKAALADWLRYGQFYRRLIGDLPPPWYHPFPPMEELLRTMRQLLEKIEIERPGRGSKKAVLRHRGIFREDTDLEEQLAETRSRREAGG
jgi:excisionase family DNA binding protein